MPSGIDPVTCEIVVISATFENWAKDKPILQSQLHHLSCMVPTSAGQGQVVASASAQTLPTAEVAAPLLPGAGPLPQGRRGLGRSRQAGAGPACGAETGLRVRGLWARAGERSAADPSPAPAPGTEGAIGPRTSRPSTAGCGRRAGKAPAAESAPPASPATLLGGVVGGGKVAPKCSCAMSLVRRAMECAGVTPHWQRWTRHSRTRILF